MGLLQQQLSVVRVSLLGGTRFSIDDNDAVQTSCESLMTLAALASLLIELNFYDLSLLFKFN